MLGYSKNVTALTDIVLYVLIVALVGELGHFDLFGGELFIEVK